MNSDELLAIIEGADKSGAESLDLNGNQLTTLPESIGRMTSLWSLNLGDNRLTALPESISQLENLGGLRLDGNQFATLPKVISTFAKLHTFSLNEIQLATLPEWRRCGLAKAILARILSDAVAEGHNLAVLTASRFGYPLYRQFGFERVFDYAIYQLARPQVHTSEVEA